MQAFYVDVKNRVVDNGRRPEECVILPAVDVVLGETEALAREKAEAINAFASPTLGLAELSNVVGVDLSSYPPDTPVAELDLGQIYQGVVDSIQQGSTTDQLTLREAGDAWARNQMTPQLVGTPQKVADQLHDLFESECCDGFMLCPSLSPGGFKQFVATVVPELQRRGLFRTEYTHTTFRGNLQD